MLSLLRDEAVVYLDLTDGEGSGVVGDLVAEPFADEVADLRETRVGHAVVSGSTEPPPCHNVGIVQYTEMLTDVRLAGPEALDDLANVQFSVVEQEPQDREPRRIAENAESFGYVFEEVFGE